MNGFLCPLTSTYKYNVLFECGKYLELNGEVLKTVVNESQNELGGEENDLNAGSAFGSQDTSMRSSSEEESLDSDSSFESDSTDVSTSPPSDCNSDTESSPSPPTQRNSHAESSGIGESLVEGLGRNVNGGKLSLNVSPTVAAMTSYDALPLSFDIPPWLQQRLGSKGTLPLPNG